jgi:hypothetical protein
MGNIIKFAMALICLALLMVLNSRALVRERHQARKSTVAAPRPGTVV